MHRRLAEEFKKVQALQEALAEKQKALAEKDMVLQELRRENERQQLVQAIAKDQEVCRLQEQLTREVSRHNTISSCPTPPLPSGATSIPTDSGWAILTVAPQVSLSAPELPEEISIESKPPAQVKVPAISPLLSTAASHSGGVGSTVGSPSLSRSSPARRKSPEVRRALPSQTTVVSSPLSSHPIPARIVSGHTSLVMASGLPSGSSSSTQAGGGRSPTAPMTSTNLRTVVAMSPSKKSPVRGRLIS